MNRFSAPRFRTAALSFAVLAAALALPASASLFHHHAAAAPQPAAPVTSAAAPGTVAPVLRTLNAQRAASHLRQLAFDAHLAAVAQGHAEDMARRNYFSHVTPEGLDPFARMRRAGYRFGYAGENIALNADVVSAHDLIWRDPPHRAIVLGPNFQRVGIGAARGRNGVVLVEDYSD